MIIRYQRDTEESRVRDLLIKELSPKVDFITSIIEPDLEKYMYPSIKKAISLELEFYRKYPKEGLAAEEGVKKAVKTFEPRTSNSCFMGKAFKYNDDHTDADLAQYRKAVGTINHPIWGTATLLEIWGGDHFEDHKEMVVAAFKYGMGIIKTKPVIKVFINPLYLNKQTKRMKLTQKQIEYQEYIDTLMAEALIFGSAKPKKKEKGRRRRT